MAMSPGDGRTLTKGHSQGPVTSGLMSRWRKSLSRLLEQQRLQAFHFDELCALLPRIGFHRVRTSGSHHVFARNGVSEIVNIQPRRDGTAKPYQLRQIRILILRYGLHLSLEDT